MKSSEYFKPKSWTWRSGVAAIVIGVAKVFLGGVEFIGVAGDVLGSLYGSSGDASSLILLGVGLIGIRAKLERLAPTK